MDSYDGLSPQQIETYLELLQTLVFDSVTTQRVMGQSSRFSLLPRSHVTDVLDSL